MLSDSNRVPLINLCIVQRHLAENTSTTIRITYRADEYHPLLYLLGDLENDEVERLSKLIEFPFLVLRQSSIGWHGDLAEQHVVVERSTSNSLKTDNVSAELDKLLDVT